MNDFAIFCETKMFFEPKKVKCFGKNKKIV